jgi:hypothetical protein
MTRPIGFSANGPNIQVHKILKQKQLKLAHLCLDFEFPTATQAFSSLSKTLRFQNQNCISKFKILAGCKLKEHQ